MGKTKLIALAGGKGGVGKTVCTANLAMGLAKRRPTLAVDMDIGCGNLNACLGVRIPEHSINEFLADDSVPLSQLKLKTPVSSLDLISGSYNVPGPTPIDAGRTQRLLDKLRDDNVDYALLDLGAGVHHNILHLFSAADVKIVVTSPESLSLHNAFVFIKSVVHRALQLEFEGEFFKARDKLLELLNSQEDTNMSLIIERFRRWSRYAAYIVEGILNDLKLYVVFNMVNGSDARRLEQRLRALTGKYLHVNLVPLGFVPFDRRIKKSINRLVPFLLEYKRSAAARAFEEISRAIEECVGRG
jgi:flagellar biosynthesis protein FlhG